MLFGIGCFRFVAAAKAIAGAVILFYSVKLTLAYIGIGTMPGVYVVVIAVVINSVMHFVISAGQTWTVIIHVNAPFFEDDNMWLLLMYRYIGRAYVFVKIRTGFFASLRITFGCCVGQ